jgi:ATP-binding cassette, subfamily B, bacterial
MPVFETFHQTVSEENILFSAKAEIDENGDFNERWLVITTDLVQVFSSENELLKRIPVTDLTGARMEQYIGGGSIIAETESDALVLARFTASSTNKFSFAVQVISHLVKGEPMPVITQKDVPRQCPVCNRPLQEGTSVCPVCLDKKKVVGRLFKYTDPYRGKMTVAIVLLILVTLLELAPPYITKIIVDRVLEPRDFGGALGLFVLGLGATGLLLALMQTVRGIIAVWIGSKIMGDIRKDIYQSLMRLSLSYFDRRQTSQFIGRVNSDAEAIRQFLTDGVLWIAGQFMMLIAIVFMLMSMDWKLALLAISPTPFVILFSITIWPKIRFLWYKQWQVINRLNMVVGDALQGIRVVKAFGQESQESSRYHKNNEHLVNQTIRTDGMWQGVFPIFSFLTGTGMLLVWYFGGKSVLNEEITLGTLMAFIAYLGMFFGPLQWFNQMMNWLSHAISSADRIFEIIDTPSDVPDCPDAISLNRVEGAVELENITFGYEKHDPILKNISLLVQPGEMIGLVGHSGAGKSTLINLVSRFYDPDQGKIKIDGVDVKSIKQEDLHKQIGVVLQETFLFDGSITENIAYSSTDASPEEIMRAAKIANAHEFIVKMSDGYDTQVGERGHRLSGGQKQRIAIARAILHNPKILILDEATASVDTETERKIQEAISRLVKGRTTFAIAHRLSTLRNADRLVVIDKGEIAEMGTHDELLDQKGIYFKLVEAQRELSKIQGVEAG